MQLAHRRRRRRCVTAVVDVATGQIPNLFEGRDAAHLRGWMAAMPATWLAQVEVVSVDSHEGYRTAVVNPSPVTGRRSPRHLVGWDGVNLVVIGGGGWGVVGCVGFGGVC